MRTSKTESQRMLLIDYQRHHSWWFALGYCQRHHSCLGLLLGMPSLTYPCLCINKFFKIKIDKIPLKINNIVTRDIKWISHIINRKENIENF